MAESHPDVELVLRARTHDLGGGMVVGRALPQMGCRAVGPVVFLDHMGPSELPPGVGFDVRPHPHIGLATVTYLFDGEIMHRDSLGFVQAIRPGAVNVMVAGRGITHSERASDEGRRDGVHLHGIQLWIALPEKDEACEPSFVHHPEPSFPTVAGEGVWLRVLLGELLAGRSPAVISSLPLFVVAEFDEGGTLALPSTIDDVAVYVVSGSLAIGSGAPLTLDRGMLAVRAAERELPIRALERSRVVIVGGAHLDGRSPAARGDRSPRHLEWNFVSSSKERLEEAKRRWRHHEFPAIPGDDQERIPLPGDPE